MPKSLLFPVLVCGLMLAVALIIKWAANRLENTARNAPRYRKIPKLLTNAEQRFWEVLIRVVPQGVDVHAKVRLCDLVECRFGNNQRDFNRISSKHVDFVLCREDSTVVGIIELDDSSHLRADRKRRDQFVDDVMGDAGIPILHVKNQTTYDANRLSSEVSELLAPNRSER